MGNFCHKNEKGRIFPAMLQNHPCKGVLVAKKDGFLCLLKSYQRLPKITTQYQQLGDPMLKNREASRLIKAFCSDLRSKYKLPPNMTNNAIVHDILTLMNMMNLTNNKAQRLCRMAKLRKQNHEKQMGVKS